MKKQLKLAIAVWFYLVLIFDGRTQNIVISNTSVNTDILSGSQNTILGQQAGSNTQFNSVSNVFIGFQAGRANAGSRNTFVGAFSGDADPVVQGLLPINYGTGNVFIGYQAGKFYGGDNKLFIDNSNTSSPLIWGDFAADVLNINGKLGIGTSSPSHAFHVTRTDAGWQGRLQNGSSNVYLAHGAGYGMHINTGQANSSGRYALEVRNSNQTHFYVRDDGNVSIGTNSPGHRFHVSGSDGGWQGRFHNGNTDIHVAHGNGAGIHINTGQSDNAGIYGLHVRNSTRPLFHVQGDGKVSIGKTDPEASLDVVRGNSVGGTAIFRGTIRDSHFNYAGDENTYIRGGKTNSHVFLNDNGGHVGVGLTSPADKLHVNGSVRWGGVTQTGWGLGQLSMNSGWGTGGQHPTIGSAGGSAGSLIMLHNPHIPFRTDNGQAEFAGRSGLRMAANPAASAYWDAGLAGDFFHIYRGGTGEFLRITNQGNVGIGTTSPGQRLSVNGVIRTASGADQAEFVEMHHNGGSGYINWSGDGAFDFRYGGSTRLSLSQGGQLQNLIGLQLKDWDDGSGGADNEYRLIGRDGSFMFYDGGVVVGDYADGSWSDVPTGQLVVKNGLSVGKKNVESGFQLDVQGDVKTRGRVVVDGSLKLNVNNVTSDPTPDDLLVMRGDGTLASRSVQSIESPWLFEEILVGQDTMLVICPDPDVVNGGEPATVGQILVDVVDLNGNLRIGESAYIDDDMDYGDDGDNDDQPDDWIKFSDFLEFKSSHATKGMVLLDKNDNQKYLNIHQEGNWSYLANSRGYSDYFLRANNNQEVEFSGKVSIPELAIDDITSNGSMAISIDNDDNATDDSFLVRKDGDANYTDLFRVRESGDTEILQGNLTVLSGSVNAVTGTFSSSLTSESLSTGSATLIGMLDGTNANFSGSVGMEDLHATTGTFSAGLSSNSLSTGSALLTGALSGTSGNFTGVVTASNFSGASMTLTGAASAGSINASSASIANAVNAGSANISGTISSASLTTSTATVGALSTSSLAISGLPPTGNIEYLVTVDGGGNFEKYAVSSGNGLSPWDKNGNALSYTQGPVTTAQFVAQADSDQEAAFVVKNASTSDEVFRVKGDGHILGKKLELTLSQWHDDVFETDYMLRPLEDLEQFIVANKHLPDIPSEAEVLEEGVDVGEMQGLLLKKIEELTLYIIEQNKQLQTQNERIAELESKLK
ncbi:MAG: hypothetical protein AAGA85_12545 [Bacteroidota bacterium]